MPDEPISSIHQTDKNAYTGKLLNNFYLRNTILLLILLSATVAKKVFMAMGFDLLGFLNTCSSFILLYLIFIFHNCVLYDQIFKRGNYFSYIILLILVLLLYNEVALPFFRSLFHIEWPLETLTDKLLLQYSRVVDIYLGFGLYLAFSYFKEREQKLKLENLNKALELKQLKEQLNPHFLFNALNNIYSYTLEESTRSGELILKLSELMRYIMRNVEKDTVSIGDEIMFINNYLSFEQERLGERCIVNMTQSIDDPETKIAPLILFVFIENVFKHGTSLIQKSEIHINITSDANSTELITSNTIKSMGTDSMNIGLINTRRRLDILYPDRHNLKLIVSDGMFYTRLLLNHR